MQSSIRTGMYPKAIKASILNTFQRLLELNNPYVRIYKQAGERLRIEPSTKLDIVIKANVKNDRTKNKPSVDEIAVLMIDDDQTIDKRDIVVTKKMTNLMHHSFSSMKIFICMTHLLIL